MSKKDRIEYLETQIAGLHDVLSNTIRELEEVKSKLANNWLIPVTNIPAHTISQTMRGGCAACARSGVCSCVTPNQFTITNGGVKQ